MSAVTQVRQERADDLLLAALDAIERAEAHNATSAGLLREARGLLRRYAETRGGDGEQQAGLTRRQEEVLRLVCGGCSNRDIAAALEISERTVKQHLHGVFTKLGVRDRAEAVAVALGVRIPEQSRGRS